MMNLLNSSPPFDPSRLHLAERRLESEIERRRLKRGAEASLAEFIRQAWAALEPGAVYVHGWHIDALCAHLEAVTNGTLTDSGFSPRLLINIPPGTMKSLTVGVFWPAWEWGPRNMPHMRYVCASHSQDHAVRDSVKMRRLVASDWYQERWGDRVSLTDDQNVKTRFENTKTGFRQAVATGSITGARGDRVILDDPHSVEDANSEAVRSSTTEWFLEAVPTRLNSPERSAIIVVMQRLHEDDVSGVIISKKLGYTHLMLPMEFEPGRICRTPVLWDNPLSGRREAFRDPRTDSGELLFPARFPAHVVERDKFVMAPYAVAGQFQQSPAPRGGGIIQRDWWQLWEPPDGKFPVFEFVLASLDSAFTEKEENDPSGFTVWGIWRDEYQVPKIMLVHAWRKHLQMHGPNIPRERGETNEAYRKRTMPKWGLCEWVADTCRRFGVHRLLIEAKASGITAAQEMQRLYGMEKWSVQLEQVHGDKVSRAHSVVPIFSQKLVYAPARAWAEMVIEETASFPKHRYKDLTDSSTQAIRWLRDNGLIQRPDERAYEADEMMRHRPRQKSVAERYFA